MRACVYVCVCVRVCVCLETNMEVMDGIAGHSQFPHGNWVQLLMAVEVSNYCPLPRPSAEEETCQRVQETMERWKGGCTEKPRE